MSRQSSIQNFDKENIFTEIVDLMQKRNDWNGFRSAPQIQERWDDGGVSWVHRGGQIVCAATYNHRQESHTRVYTTAMAEEYWYPDSWTQMIKGILLESPHDRIISKTPVNSSERQLWEKNAMKLREENGLMIWEWFDTAAMEMLRQW